MLSPYLALTNLFETMATPLHIQTISKNLDWSRIQSFIGSVFHKPRLSLYIFFSTRAEATAELIFLKVIYITQAKWNIALSWRKVT